MMKIIVDTNLWISFLIGKKTDSLRQLLLRDDIIVYVCRELIDEFISVVSRPKIQKYTSLEDIDLTLDLMHSYCQGTLIQCNAQSPVRDAKDLYLLSLAETVSADYILTGDKDLLTLEKHQNTRIISLTAFTLLLQTKL